MNTPSTIAQQILQEDQNKQQSIQESGMRAEAQRSLTDNLEELKLANIVQTKLLSDELSRHLQAILDYLQNQKPEVTKKEMLTGFDQIIVSVKKITDVLPKEIDKLNKTISKPQENYWTEARMAKVLKGSFPKFPDIKIPEPKDTISVTNLGTVEQLLATIAKKPNFEPTQVTIPESKPFPKAIEVSNLSQVIEALAKQPKKEPESTGFSWNEDENGNLDSFTEYYPNGNVVSTGFNIGRVRIRDDRTN